MPKMKTNRGAAKRMRRTGSGKVKRMRAYKSHILTKKSKKRKRRLRKSTLVAKAEMKKVDEDDRKREKDAKGFGDNDKRLGDPAKQAKPSGGEVKGDGR